MRTHARVAHVEPGTVVLDDGSRLPAGAVVVGIGARPATAWLGGSGIELGAHREIVADEWLRTSAPDVYAVGDCASFPSGRYGERLLVHHWDNALQGPRTVAANIVGGTSAAYDPVPYFWSEQFGRFVQYAGHHASADTMVWRGDPADRPGRCAGCVGSRLVAVLAVGRPRDLAQGRRLIEAGTPMDCGASFGPFATAQGRHRLSTPPARGLWGRPSGCRRPSVAGRARAGEAAHVAAPTSLAGLVGDTVAPARVPSVSPRWHACVCDRD